ncbi:MAG TPA: hypothetical protein VEG34_06520, partial [Thermoanaerobaculia bacterium]|nr:hypothetical protein [Thermoanaerobaculia bacterium]
YAVPPASVAYYYSNRDAFRLDDISSTDLSFNYGFTLNTFGKEVELYLQPEVLNLFDEQGVGFVNQAVQDATTTPACPPTKRNCRPGEFKPGDTGFNPNGLYPFNPFTEKPVEGVHWRKGGNFGKATNELHFQVPRTFRLSLGFKF